jgi:hypothetical protein
LDFDAGFVESVIPKAIEDVVKLAMNREWNAKSCGGRLIYDICIFCDFWFSGKSFFT